MISGVIVCDSISQFASLEGSMVSIDDVNSIQRTAFNNADGYP